MVSYSAIRRTSLADGGSIFKDLFNKVTIAPPNTHKVHLGEEKYITAAEVSLAVRTLEAAGCDEIQPELLKALNGEVIWQLVCLRWPGVLDEH